MFIDVFCFLLVDFTHTYRVTSYYFPCANETAIKDMSKSITFLLSNHKTNHHKTICVVNGVYCILMPWCKTAVSPVLMYWKYCSFLQSHRFNIGVLWNSCGPVFLLNPIGGAPAQWWISQCHFWNVFLLMQVIDQDSQHSNGLYCSISMQAELKNRTWGVLVTSVHQVVQHLTTKSHETTKQEDWILKLMYGFEICWGTWSKISKWSDYSKPILHGFEIWW